MYGAVAEPAEETPHPAKIVNKDSTSWGKTIGVLFTVIVLAAVGVLNLSSTQESKQLVSNEQFSTLPSVHAHTGLSKKKLQSLKANVPLDDDMYSIKTVECGTSVMKLSCIVTVEASTASNLENLFLQYVPLDHPSTKKAVRSLNFKTLPGKETSIEIYRLRPDANYQLNLYVGDSDTPEEQIDSVLFRSAKTGYDYFDDGAINTIHGEITYPLLNFALHTEGFRGVVATDMGGYVVWYFNSTTEFHKSHIEAVEQNGHDHVWCINDQGDTGGGVSVRVINAAGTTLAISYGSYSYQGHECRFTEASKNAHVLISSSHSMSLPNSRNINLYYEEVRNRVTDITNEYIQVWEPNYLNDSQHDNGVIVNITMNRWLDWETIYGFYVATRDLNSTSNATETSIAGTNHAWEDLDLEYQGPTSENTFTMRYIHVSSISVSEDGSLYVVTFRDCHCVVGLNRTTHEKEFMLSSVIPGVATHEFLNDFHKFYAPHDVSYHSDGKLCLMDDGIKRPQGACEDDDTATCWSRAICYELDDEHSSVNIVWEFSYPSLIQDQGSPYNISTFTDIIFNINGGSLRRTTDNKWVAAFTAISDSSSPYNKTNYVFGLDILNDAVGHGAVNVTSIVQIPHSIDWEPEDGTSGSYRATPIMSINGETHVDA